MLFWRESPQFEGRNGKTVVKLQRLGLNTDKIAVNEAISEEIRGMCSRAEVLLKQLSDQQVAKNDRIASLQLEIDREEKEIAKGADLAQQLQRFQSLFSWSDNQSEEI
jgi:hypothetical protein